MSGQADDMQLVQRSLPSSSTSTSPPSSSDPLVASSDVKQSVQPVEVQNKTKKLKPLIVYLAFPIISLVVGTILLLAEVTIIVLVLATPDVVAIPEEAQLTTAQRIVLGVVSIVMVVEAFILGTIDAGSERKRTSVLKARKKLAEKHLRKLKAAVDGGYNAVDGSREMTDPTLSLQELTNYLVEQADLTHYLTHLRPFSRLKEEVSETTEEVKELRREVDHHTIRYIATLVFELASFLWKWAIAVLVISNNWVSVGVAIVGAVVYPIVGFWKKTLLPKK